MTIKHSEYIYEITRDEVAHTAEMREFAPGFYFSDATWNWNGPFDTKAVAEKALAEYAESL